MKIIFALFLLFTSLLNADETELGIGVGLLSYPDYIGSKSTRFLAVPLPYLRYSSSSLNIDEDGLNAKIFGVEDLSLNLSFDGSLPANSEDNLLRKGMQDLDFLMEVGPNLIYKIYKDDFSNIHFQFPVRAALSTDFSNLRYQGITSNPHIKYTLAHSDFEFIFSSGVIFSDKDYNSYFYNVESLYVTQTRHQYNSKGGFGGIKNKASFTYRKNKWVLGAFLSHFNIKNAVFKDSPLVETNSALYFGTSLSYLFYISD